MKLSKHENHRNADYLKWLRKQSCVASDKKAQCAHHVRLGTNGGSALKPSDYFCIPLRNEFHTTGLFALHVVGEDTFLKHFKLNTSKLFIKYLKSYLKDKFDIKAKLAGKDEEAQIAYLISLAEQNKPKSDKLKKKKKKKLLQDKVEKVSVTESEFYQKAKEAKKAQDRKLREELKKKSKSPAKPKKTSESRDLYEKSKELKRKKDKELRDKLKKETKKPKVDLTKTQFYQNAKELKRKRDKELRDKLKLSSKKKVVSKEELEYKQKAKELKRKKDKEFRDKLKAERKKKK